jgi:nucleotide sugar dehydrogenase
VSGHGTAAVIGLGYVGLPLAREAAAAGWQVIGLDAKQSVVDGLESGVSHIDDVSDGDVEQMLARGFAPTTNAQDLSRADVIVICVPTPLSLDGGPDLGAVTAAGAAIAGHLRAGQLVILESTTYPGTTEEVLIPLLESSGLLAGQDVNVAFSPERIDPGNERFGVTNTPKVVGGLTPACAERASAFYLSFVDTVVRAKGLKEAEMTKLLENTYRHVNIALVNEMARFCHLLDIDLWDAIRCASSKPFGFQAFYPGPGVGGHCIPIDPNYLSHRVRTHLGQPFRFVELAQEINAGMPTYVARRAQDVLNARGKAVNGSRIALVGVTYKADISDQRESPAVAVAVALHGLGAHLSYIDPYVNNWRVGDLDVDRHDDLKEAAEQADLVILLQPHRSLPIDTLVGSAAPVLDTRGLLQGSNIETL